MTSVISGEWVEMGDMSREALIATKGLILTSPFLAYAFKVGARAMLVAILQPVVVVCPADSR